MNINWQSDQVYLFLNPRLPSQEAALCQSIHHFSKEFAGHIWLATSGSTQVKLVALHKRALLFSAQAVNKHLQATSKDIWINPLPCFHVGGLGIWARSYLNRAAVHPFSEKWSPHNFHKMLSDFHGTLTSLVPAQVYDLVIHNLSAPPSLRAVVVGGGALQNSLYKKARQLRWPLLPSYGLTECSSQVATASLESLTEPHFPPLEMLSHVKVKIDEKGFINIHSPSLYSAYAQSIDSAIHFSYHDKNQWFVSEDRGALTGPFLEIFGRSGDFLKIGGENVEFGRLEKILEDIKLQQQISFDISLAAIPDLRLGHAIHLFSTHPNTESLQNHFDSQVMPYERIRKIHIISTIPRSPLGKVLKTELIKIASIKTQNMHHRDTESTEKTILNC